MERVAIIGSCITRDLWPILGVEPEDLIYISRTSLASLFSAPWGSVEVADDPPGGLNRAPHMAVVADLKKSTLAALVAHRPSHILFDFIDERFDLLACGNQVATHSWELEVSGYLAQPELAAARRIPRLSNPCDLLWKNGLAELAAFLSSTPLHQAQIILHESQWAATYLDSTGQEVSFDETWEQMPGVRVSKTAHNSLLSLYQTRFLQHFPRARRVAAPGQRLADANHRWGLSPFHYVDAYYHDIWGQLPDLTD